MNNYICFLGIAFSMRIVYNVYVVKSEEKLMKDTVFYLVRHGQSLGNAIRTYLGHTNLDLSELGYKQAKITAEHLRSVPFDAIYSSDLLRAHNTAVPHAELRGIPIVDSVQLRELDLGDWEGMPIDTLVSEHREQFVEKWLGEFGPFAFPGGESVVHGADRFYSELVRIAEKHEGKTVLVTAHAAVIRAFWCKINEVAPLSEWGKAFPFSTNASYSVCHFDGERFVPKEYSQDSHFADEEIKGKKAMSTKFIIERHGQSEGNAKEIYLGHTDLPLTEKGREQAELAAKALSGEKIDVVYSSDLKRAYETALPHARLRGIEVKTSEKLRELYVGEWEGLTNSEIKEKYGEQMWIARTYRDFVYPSGESLYDAYLRMREEIIRIGRENEGKTVLIVSHSAAIRSLWYYACGYTDENMLDRVKFMVNSSYSILTYENGELIPGEYGVTSHLPEDTVYLA